jgi:hypothetical protein
VHHAFATETFFTNSDSVTATQPIIKWHFNTGRHGSIPGSNIIKHLGWEVSNMASATNKN